MAHSGALIELSRMRSLNSGQSLSIAVVAVAVFNTISAASFPVPDRKPTLALVGLWLALVLAHAALYWVGPGFRDRFGLRAYVASQTALIAAVGLAGALFPVALALLIAFTAQVVVLAGDKWGSIAITIIAILVYVLDALVVSDLYRAATAGLLLTLTGVMTHGAAALLQRHPHVPASRPPIEPTAMVSSLTAREAEILRVLATGSRSSQIAAGLGITERTVKAHLASIYQKLGVSSRSAAVTVAHHSGLVGRDARKGAGST
jgi:DNA-binding CsgD family transcriptional regulator